MIEQGFKVLTEFRFDVASAIVNSEKLQESVGGISAAADKALFSMKSLSMGIVGQFGLGVGSLVGFLASAINYADKFQQYQIKIANQFQNGGMFKGVNGFQNAMEASESALMNMQKVAQRFSLPSTDLVNTATLIGAALTSKGMDNSSLSKSTDLARMYMKVSPMLGVDTGISQGELLGLIGGRADMGGRLVQRLFGDTKTLHKFNGQGGTQAFNRLNEHKRLEMLSQAMGELANNMDAAHAMAGTFNGQLTLLKDNLFGVFSMFRNLGNILKAPLTMIMHTINQWISQNGKKLVDTFAKVLGPILANPERLLVSLLQARKFKGDVKSTGHAMETGGILLGIGHALEWLSITARFASPWVMALGAGVYALGDAVGRAFPFLAPMIKFLSAVAMISGIVVGALTYFIGWADTLLLITKLAGFLGATLATLATVGLPLLAFFQLLSRAVAIAQIADAKFLVGALQGLADSFIYFKNVVGILAEPLLKLFNGIAQFISPIFRMSLVVEFLQWALDKVTKGLTLFLMGVQGLAFALMQIVSNIGQILTGQMSYKNALSGVSDAYEGGMKDIYEKVYGAIEKGDVTAVAQNTTNIAKVEINNQFKEQMEPDRIAFSLKDQLLKAAANPLQAGGRSMAARAAR